MGYHARKDVSCEHPPSPSQSPKTRRQLRKQGEYDADQANVYESPELFISCDTPTTVDQTEVSPSSPTSSSFVLESPSSSSFNANNKVKSPKGSPSLSYHTNPHSIFLDFAAQAFSRGYMLPSLVSREQEKTRIYTLVQR